MQLRWGVFNDWADLEAPRNAVLVSCPSMKRGKNGRDAIQGSNVGKRTLRVRGPRRISQGKGHNRSKGLTKQS